MALTAAGQPTPAGAVDASRATLSETIGFVRRAGLVDVPDWPVAVIDMPADLQGIVPAVFQQRRDRGLRGVADPGIARRDGGRFDLRAYHDAVLAHGRPPVRLLRTLLLGR